MQNTKRKQTFDEPPQEPSKRHRLDFALKRRSPWNNLKLLLCIQDKHHDLSSKVNQAFNFVQSRVDHGVSSYEDCKTIQLPRLLSYLNDWILTLLFPPNGKKNWGDGQTPQLEGIDAYMDVRCWEIFKFCLQESLKFHISLSMPRNLLQTVQFVTRNALSLLEDSSISSGELFISGEKRKLCDSTLDCISLVFSSHGGLSNKNLDLWVETAKVLLELVLKMYSNNLDGSDVGAFALRFLWSVLHPFSKLRVHRAKKGFHNFVDKLLEPLLHLSGELHLQVNRSNTIWTSRLIEAVEEVLSHGLFHHVHIPEFLSLHVSENDVASCDDKSNDSKATIKSYTRHLFDVLNKIIARKNDMAVSSLGLLFHLYVNSARKFKLDEGRKTVEEIDDVTRKPVPEKHCGSNNISADIQKSLFNFFVLIMEPLLLKINAYIQVEVDANLLLLDFHALLKSIGKLLASFMQDKVYVRTEDTAGGACLNFLKKIFNTLIVSFAGILHFSNYGTTNRMDISIIFPGNEILVSIGYLLQIEYEVVGEDLVNLWLVVLSCSAINSNLVNVLDQFSLPSTIPALGCQTIHLYSQLRQVEIAILALCQAIRLVIPHEANTEGSSRFLTFLSNEFHSEAVEMLLSSEKFITAISKAVESIPEGQVCGFIRLITEDISESLRWMKDFCPSVDGKKMQIFNLQMELLGRGLSRLYCVFLGSVVITDSNRILLGVAVKELMALMHPYLSILVGQQPGTICKFFSSVIGETVDEVVRKGKVLKKFSRSSQWILVFFFQLFVSCRNLYRQTSFMPLGYTAYSAFQLTQRIDEIDFDFFSWIVQPSASLFVVMQFISNIYLEHVSDDSSPLMYIFQSMALQRLVDLNKHIKLFKYLKKTNYLQKKSYRCQIKTLKEEATGLTNFIMDYLSCVYQSPILVSSYVTCQDVVSVATQRIQFNIKARSNQWDLGVYVANQKSLPTLIWSNLCKNVEIWSNHASKKQLNKFVSHLLQAYLHSGSSSFQKPSVQEIDKCKLLKSVTLSQVSLELLNDPCFYQQKFAQRSLASMFCHALEKSVQPLFSNIPCTDVNLQSLPNWLEFLSSLDNLAVVVDENKEIVVNCSAVGSSTIHSCDKLLTDISRKDKTFPDTKNFTDCHNLLDLLCWKGDKNARSFSHLVTCIFNLERLLVSALLYFQSTKHQDYYCEYLRLFVSCRKTLLCILNGFYEETDTIQSLPNSIISGSSLPVLWLSKSLSLFVGIKEAFSTKNISLCKSMVFSLMNYTSRVLFSLGKYQFVHTFSISKEAETPCEEISNHKISHEENHLLPYSEDSSKLEALKCLTFMADNLKAQIQSLLASVHNTDVNVGFGLTYENINRLSSAACGFSRFLWGLTSSTGQSDAKDSDKKEKMLMWIIEHASELNSCISSLVELTNIFVSKLFMESNQLSKSSHNTQHFEKPAAKLSFSSTNFLSSKHLVSKANALVGTPNESKAAATCFTPSAVDNVPKLVSDLGRKLKPKSESSIASCLAKVDPTELQGLNKPLLQSLVKGDHPEIAFLLRQLLIVFSSLLRLNLQKDDGFLSSSFVSTFIEISQILLLEFTEMVVVPQHSVLLLLDGACNYLRELAGYFLFTDPICSRKVYTKLIQTHLMAMGKTILLQRKRATLAFHKRQSSTKTLHKGSVEVYSSTELPWFSLDDFEDRLQESFKAYIEGPSDLHLLSTIRAVERSLIGVQEGCTVIHDIKTSKDGGEISSLVAAGIYCFVMILKFVSGQRGLKMIKRHCQSFVAAVFNIIVHLQSLPIFYDNLASGTDTSAPDPGSAILMGVEVLVTVSRKHSLFPMDVWQVGHLLHIPAALFQNFHQFKVTKASGPSEALIISEDHIFYPVDRVDFCHADHRFLVNLFKVCCELLYTIIMHRPSECKQCVAHLEASVAVLLNCLETVSDESMMNKVCFSSEEGVRCASCFQRIFEEIKKQKHIFGRQCSLFLSNYIWVCSGYGPKRSGIRREVYEALRPGVNALIDVCSESSDDYLQYLHTVFGEGPCRNILASLLHDHKLTKYEGKV